MGSGYYSPSVSGGLDFKAESTLSRLRDYPALVINRMDLVSRA